MKLIKAHALRDIVKGNPNKYFAHVYYLRISSFLVTITGSEVFSSYEKSKFTPFAERLSRWLAWLLILGGIFLIIIAIV